MKFYICKHCGQIITKLKDKNIPNICCGEYMTELVAGVTEASTEKHIPVYKIDNNIVKVNIGSVPHPMTSEHYIEWVCLETKKGFQINHLKPEDQPETQFAITNDDEILSVYAYCNLHSLWKTE